MQAEALSMCIPLCNACVISELKFLFSMSLLLWILVLNIMGLLYICCNFTDFHGAKTMNVAQYLFLCRLFLFLPHW